MKVDSPLLFRKFRSWTLPQASSLYWLFYSRLVHAIIILHSHLQLGRTSGPFPYEIPNTILYPVLIPPCVLHVQPLPSPYRPRSIDHEHNIRNSWRNLPQPPLASNPLTAKYYSVLQHPQPGFMKHSCNRDICRRYCVLCYSVQSDASSWLGPPSTQSYKIFQN
jgi:hypothetical protein